MKRDRAQPSVFYDPIQPVLSGPRLAERAAALQLMRGRQAAEEYFLLAYLDPSGIDAAIRADRAPKEFSALLAKRGYTPVASHMVLHELARPMVFGKEAIAVEQCRFLRALAPSWHLSLVDLFRREVAFFRRHETITPVLEDSTLRDTLVELDGLCDGIIRDSLRSAIEERGTERATEWRESMKAGIANARALRRTDPTAAQRFTTLHQFKEHWAPNLHLLLANVPSTRLTAHEARSLAPQLANYPAIQANMNCLLYLLFIMHKDEVVPAHDRLDDFRHAAEATYCQALLSNDKGLLKALPDIAPRVKPLSWQELAAAA